MRTPGGMPLWCDSKVMHSLLCRQGLHPGRGHSSSGSSVLGNSRKSMLTDPPARGYPFLGLARASRPSRPCKHLRQDAAAASPLPLVVMTQIARAPPPAGSAPARGVLASPEQPRDSQEHGAVRLPFWSEKRLSSTFYVRHLSGWAGPGEAAGAKVESWQATPFPFVLF